MAQMTMTERNGIEYCLRRGWTIPQTAQTWTGIVNMLYRTAGPALFRRLFPVMLEDNGPCFSDPVMTENARTPNNLYKLVPRTKVFYCDPYCATQKPQVERNHKELRRILVKGANFNALDQDDINVALSNINSYTRASLGNDTPYAAFVKTYGEDARKFLDRLGVAKYQNPAGFKQVAAEFERSNYAISADLPEMADPKTLTAKLENGVLTVVIKKRAESQPREIEIL